MQKISHNLRNLRLERNWSQNVLAEKSKVKQAYISQIENGKRSPSLLILEQLTRALDCSPEDLVGRTLFSKDSSNSEEGSL